MARLGGKPAAEVQEMRMLIIAMGLEELQQHCYSHSMTGLNLVYKVTGWIKFYFITSYKICII
jgi:hypothetical protein